MSIIEVNNVTKEYQLGHLKSLKHSVLNTFGRLRGQEVEKPKPFKALDDVSFKVEPGEVLGIIGSNGAGKSTMLKMLARISTPTRGEVKVHGSVAPLIEVGAGLVGDLTGRENVFLNGSILGISRAEIKKKFDEIVAFAELEEFIDTPIKRYSSGMAVRLGFAIATSVDADILIVDEVLAVGDLAFQRKCFDRMEDILKRQGKTVLIVSHNIRQVQRMCSRVILMNHGKIMIDGKPNEVCDRFYQENNAKINAHNSARRIVNLNSSDELELCSINILDDNGRPANEIRPGGMLRVQICFKANQFLRQPEIIVGTHTTDFVYLNSSTTAVFEDRPDYPPGVHEIEYVVPSFPLASGVYCIRFVVFDQYRRKIFEGETLKIFTVATTDGQINEPDRRILKLPAEWKLGGQRYCEPLTQNLRSVGIAVNQDTDIHLTRQPTDY